MMRHPTDENILLLAHGELSAWRGFPLQIHLRRCPQCQARYAELAKTSAQIADFLRGPEAAPWKPAETALNIRFRIASLVALILLIGTLGGLFYLSVLSRQPRTSPVNTVKSSDGCAPGLVGDRCR